MTASLDSMRCRLLLRNESVSIHGASGRFFPTEKLTQLIADGAAVVLFAFRICRLHFRIVNFDYTTLGQNALIPFFTRPAFGINNEVDEGLAPGRHLRVS